MEDTKKQHLEFIQNIITRMNTNSFQIKGMAIAIVSALLAICAGTNNVMFILIGIAPTILFWFLDTYYLQQERKFIGIYNDVAGLKNVIKVRAYDMPIYEYTKKVDKQFSFFDVFFSVTIWPLYCGIIVVLLLTGLFIKYKNCFPF